MLHYVDVPYNKLFNNVYLELYDSYSNNDGYNQYLTTRLRGMQFIRNKSEYDSYITDMLT
jgi:hypothetical protein